MELRHLRYFLAVAEQLNFTRAAKALRVAQPALSTQVRDLEHELGVRLFERGNRYVQLTPAGTVFREHAAAMIGACERMVSSARLAAKAEIGRINIGYVAWLRPDNFTQLLRQFHERFPGVEISLQDLAPTEQAKRLLEGNLHVAFTSMGFDGWSDQLDSRPVGSYPLRLVVGVDHPFSHRSELSLRDARDETFVFLSSALSPVFVAWVRSLCLNADFTPKVLQECIHPETAMDLVEAGLGVTLLADVGSRLRQWKVHLCSLTQALPPFHQSIAWRKGNLAAPVEAFLEMVREVYG